jgi:ribosomal-protein-alanine N-acetyltransferase
MTSFIFETPRLTIRAFQPDDLLAIHRILDLTFGDGSKIANEEAQNERRSWLEWSRLSAEWLPKMFQPPYGDRAVVLKSSGEVIGAVGYVPCFDVFEQIPGLSCSSTSGGIESPAGSSNKRSDRLKPPLQNDNNPSVYRVAEMGLFWAIDPQHQRHGYATEAAQALIDFAFQQLRAKRLIATTEYDNAASMGVMRKLGMRIERNPLPQPSWLQVVGILQNRSDEPLA